MDNVFKHTLHRELWQWLADNPSELKEDWVGWKSNGGDVKNFNDCYCFACEHSLKTKKLLKARQSKCICPLIWIGGYCLGFNDDDGLFTLWENSTDNHQRTELALKIKNLPVKDGVICE